MPSSSEQIKTSPHTLEIDSVNLSFGMREILSGVYLKMETGKVTSLLGRNGCGKSCLMRIIIGDLNPTYKSVRIDGVWQKRISCKQVLYCPQNCSIPKHLKIKDVFNDFGLEIGDFATLFPGYIYEPEHKVGELSGGEVRILETYIVLKAPSMFAILDEPFSQIMPIHIEVIKKIIREEKHNKGILISDHYYSDVLDISDSIYVIDQRTTYQAFGEDDLIRHGYLR